MLASVAKFTVQVKCFLIAIDGIDFFQSTEDDNQQKITEVIQSIQGLQVTQCNVHPT